MKAIHESMREARENKRMSKAELSRESGVCEASICKYESGLTQPGLYNMIALADSLGISLDTYIGRNRLQRKT